MLFFENGHKKEAPSLFCFEPCRQARLTAQCSDGALVFFDLSHIIEIKGVGGLDHQLAGAIFLDVKGVSLIVVSQQFVSWMLRYVVLITEKRSHASKLQDTLVAFIQRLNSPFSVRIPFFSIARTVAPSWIVGSKSTP